MRLLLCAGLGLGLFFSSSVYSQEHLLALEEGQAQLESGSIEGAVEAFVYAIEAEPSSWNHIWSILWEFEQPSLSEKLLVQLAEHWPNDYTAQLYAGALIAEKSPQPLSALKLLDRALELAQEDSLKARVNYYQGVAHLQGADFARDLNDDSFEHVQALSLIHI